MTVRSNALDATPRERILVLFTNPANLALISAMLSDRYLVYASMSDLDLTDADGPFDLCIVDNAALQQFSAQLLAIRAKFRPVLLPVLALLDRRTGPWSPRIWDVADDVLMRPVERLELSLRVASLMRLRAMSVEVNALGGRLAHERRIAQRLQDAGMPQVMQLPGLHFSGVYRPGSGDANVGGDWYDSLQLSDGRTVITIGDVTGSGLDAAVTMMNVRQMLRGIAFLHPDPAMMLDAADRALNASDTPTIVTAFVGVYDATTFGLRFSSAGHPRPLLRRARGEVETIENYGTPLGLPWRMGHVTDTVQVNPGDHIVLYTDGLIEADRDPVAAEQRLRAFVASYTGLDADNAAEVIYHHMIADEASDDVAIMVLRIADNPAIRRWTLETDDRRGVRATLDAMGPLLAQAGVSEAAMVFAETIFAELVGNVVRHAPGTMGIALDCSGPAPVLHVMDRGPGFHYAARPPSDLLAERGRGLYMVATLAAHFSIEHRRDGGSHARAVLPAFAGGVTGSVPIAFDGFAEPTS